MTDQYQHLGEFSDLVRLAGAHRPLFTATGTGQALAERIRETLGVLPPPERPDARTEHTWTRDGVDGEEVSWSAGFGPRTRAWVLRPAGETGRLPGVLVLHCHSGVKWAGKEKVADGPEPVDPELVGLRARLYDGRPVASDLARAGFTVLCHDTVGWGSRAFPLHAMPERILADAEAGRVWAEHHGEAPTERQRYDLAARHHEHVLAKYCGLLGTSFAGLVVREDMLAVDYLLSRPDVDPAGVAAVGLSGGGARAALLHALDGRMRAAVVVAMMSTFAAMLDRHVEPHTWMLVSPGLGRVCDWPDVAAARAPAPLMVLYATEDQLFPVAGMRQADRALRARYTTAGRPEAYVGAFHPGPHRFSAPMQRQAVAWLAGDGDRP